MTLIKKLGAMLIFFSAAHAATGDRITFNSPRLPLLEISIQFNVIFETYGARIQAHEAHRLEEGQIPEGATPLFTGHARPKIMDLKNALKVHDAAFYGLLKEGVLLTEDHVLESGIYTILSEAEYLEKEIERRTQELADLEARLAAIRVSEMR